QALHDLGYFNDEVSGNYLSATTTAVKRAQKMMNYKIDGSATYALLERIMDNSAPTLEECRSYSLLKVGDKSDSVAKLQQRLIELGFFNNYSSSHKGKFTYATLEACKEVQRMRGLNSIDDFASAEFQAYLFSDAAYYHSYSYIEE
ncbi:MAG: peptidoglycan-binding protein, partial [Lachnospiraceae bacterium]|nr:peptidoglycan-binding protein [Lachnospiraceae bacterium]